MRYKSFRIQNFKGIKDATINLDGVGGAAVFALVGLNESGKTTVLEAIHSFSPESATGELLGGAKGIGIPYKDRVPRHLISTFTGDVSVTATVALNDSDKEQIAAAVKETAKLEVDDLPNELVFQRQQRFANGDFQNNYFSMRTNVSVRGNKRHKWRLPTHEETVALRDAIYELTPDIAYFPTFVFNFPKRVFLTDRGNSVDTFYSTVFQDILDYDGRGHTIERDIVGRIRSKELVVSWLQFFTAWAQHDGRDKIQHVMDRASVAVTRLVFGRWNTIFGEDTRGKEIVISYDIVEGEKTDDRGVSTKTQEHDIYIKFQIRDGTRRFDINDRSLGFRWFFAFMLFTQFRVSRAGPDRKLLFLFDEPASNLHAAAQQKLIDCFPGIARDDHMLIYSTHSHYMIEPKWLEQTFIITNRADAPGNSILDEISLDDESLDVKVASYRSFVNEHPNQTSYFQPILDRLEVAPSRFDINRSSVILEGKSDYYILRYAAKLQGMPDLPFIPALGAGTFDALASLHVGWNLDFLFLLDGDKQGLEEKKRYSQLYGISANRLATISELSGNIKVIEDLLDEEALKFIQSELSLPSSPNKSQIRRFFQERLASDKTTKISAGFSSSSKGLLHALRSRLNP
ncbi:AAA family ATPase [Bradyrhizobium sp. 35]|uniref:ATP-dependent nuclease n=1 Tax=Bradyrhizobium sp. 35 TaxID=2782670 RepID=UPI001FFA9510|nr:AAA family ATPase [Bradyrhizobium sp. 35]